MAAAQIRSEPSPLVATSNLGASWSLMPNETPLVPLAVDPFAGSSPSYVVGALTCPSRSRCVAVGSGGPQDSYLGSIETWNGRTWRPAVLQDDPPNTDLLGISCVGGFCAAVGNAGGVSGVTAIGRGNVWQGELYPATSLSTTALSDVSCVSSTWCMAVGDIVEIWDGRSWMLGPVPKSALGHLVIDAIACTTETFCHAVGGEGTRPVAASWNGRTWSTSVLSVPAGARGARLFAIACPTPWFCIAVGVAHYGSTQQAGGLVESWSGRAWSARVLPFGGGFLQTLGCSSATACLAAGLNPIAPGASRPAVVLVERWNGTSWSRVRFPSAIH